MTARGSKPGRTIGNPWRGPLSTQSRGSDGYPVDDGEVRVRGPWEDLVMGWEKRESGAGERSMRRGGDPIAVFVSGYLFC